MQLHHVAGRSSRRFGSSRSAGDFTTKQAITEMQAETREADFTAKEIVGASAPVKQHIADLKPDEKKIMDIMFAEGVFAKTFCCRQSGDKLCQP